MTQDGKLLEEYRHAAEALLDAVTVLQAHLHTRDKTEYKRLLGLVAKCQAELDRVRGEFERHEDM
jgi:hypothetical protein